LEAISRGAARATFIERHFPTADIIRQNAVSLGVEDRCAIHPANTFLFFRRVDVTLPEWQDLAWVVFCSPPYALYVEEHDAMLQMIQMLIDAAPLGSVFMIEADETFDRAELPAEIEWDLREYHPARIAWGKKESPAP
jgi:16S rRNA G966 N2-methylase RsmD